MHVKILYLTYLVLLKNTEVVTSKASSKIIGGRPVNIKYRPFMLSLHTSQGHKCGASILSRKWAITALHCVTSMNSTLDRATNYYVRAGSNKPYVGGSLHRLIKIHAYNDTRFSYWFSSMEYYDIALFEVSPQFRFSKFVQAVQLPSIFSTPPRLLYVSGWGYTNFQSNPKISNVLMGVYVHHTPYEVCANETPEYKILVREEHHLCYGANGKDACYGDSGGPLASKNTIYGIVSFGQNCALVSGVYARVSYYRRWIRQVTKL